ncbi:MAG: MBL fold metallo-hydrolase, partial [Actinomycetota bacterium]
MTTSENRSDPIRPVTIAPAALHWFDAAVEVHKLVVGPYDNNVFIVRCRTTGDAVLIDAANEHDVLLDLARRLGVRNVLETHGHHDHIQAIPAMRE